jgi:hypothetical protein
MPVSQLERQRGPARRARERILGRRAMSAGGWMAIICAHFEVSIMMSLYVLVAAMTPWESTNLGSFLQHLSTSGQSPYGFGNLLVQAIATTLVAPLFVCSGFSLYLNRRTQLEAWDIEVNLRRIEERASAMTLSDRRRAARSLVIALLATAVLMFPRGQATADEASGVTPPAQREPPTAATEDDAAREALKGVLAAPEFQTTKVEKRWRLRPRERSDPPGGHWERLTGFFQLLAEVLRGIVWIVAIAGGATVIVLVAKRLVPAAPAPDAHRPQDVLLGMEIGPASLPRDVASAARDLLLRGEARAALALLYRGALSAIVHQHRVEVTPGATEADVLGAYRTAVGGDASIYFERLVRQWAAAAYAGQPIDPGAGRALCDDWPRYFDPAASPLNA